MESLLLAAGLVVPMMVYMLVGFFIRRSGILSDTDLKKLNSMLFKIMIPLSVFFDLYQCDLQTAAQPRLFAMVAAGILEVDPDGALEFSGYLRSNASVRSRRGQGQRLGQLRENSSLFELSASNPFAEQGLAVL